MSARGELMGIRRRRRVTPLRVVLIHLPTITAPRSLSYYGAVPPLGLAYVAAATSAAGHDVQVIDATGAALDARITRHTAAGPLDVTGLTLLQIVGRVGADVDVIGISHMFLHQWPLLRDLVTALAARRPRARIVLGGENASAFWQHILNDAPAVEACVLGEGEQTFVELLDAWSAGRDTASVAGVAHRDPAGTPVRTEARARIEAIDELPQPAWSLFPVEAYLSRHRSGGIDRGRSMPLLTSRGCPYRCSFCSSPEMWTTRYVRRDAEKVVDEIADLVARYRVRNVDLHDLTAMLTKEWLLEFARALIARKLGITFQLPSGTRSEAVDEEAARLLYEAGCRNFCYAPESGSPKTLERIHKKVSIPRLRESMRAASDAGLRTHASIIVGFPHEGPAEILETGRFVLQLALDGADTAAVMVFAPYPGSEEYERLRAAGVIVHDDLYFYSSLLRSAGARRSVHPRWSSRELAAIQLGLLAGFYGASYARRPLRLLRVIGRAIEGTEESVMDHFLATKMKQWGLGRRSSGDAPPSMEATPWAGA